MWIKKKYYYELERTIRNLEGWDTALVRKLHDYEARLKSMEKYLGIEYATETTESFHKKAKSALTGDGFYGTNVYLKGKLKRTGGAVKGVKK